MKASRHGLSTLATVLITAGCGHAAQPPRSMAPGNCARPHLRPVPAGAAEIRPLLVHGDTVVGITVVPGTASPGWGYWVDHAYVDVLRLGAPRDNRIFGRLDTTVLSVRADNFADSANRTLTLTFTGKDRAGRVLPPGRYSVMAEVEVHGSGKCLAKFRASGREVITQLDWRG
jgi:hypothetical protein